MRTILKWAAFLSLLVASDAAATVCRLPGLQGYESAARRAKQHLPATTRDLSKIAIYVERDSTGDFYFHSNFVSDGAENATKIGHEPTLRDLEWALQNIVWTESPTPTQKRIVQDALRTKATIFLDRSVFKEDGTTDLGLKGVNVVTLVDQNSSVSTGGLVINRDLPPPLFAERILGCCLHGRPIGGKALVIREGLGKVSLKEENLKLISLVSDTATKSSIANSRLSKLDSGVPVSEIVNVQSLTKVFEAQKGKEVVILGHVENGNFVIRDSSGTSQATLPISDLRDLANRNDVLLVEIGCNTAGVGPSSQGPGIGIATRFNTVDATKRMAAALETSKTLADFLNGFASESVQVVVDSQVVEKQLLYRAQYYSSPSGGSTQRLVAEINVVSRNFGLFGSWTPKWMR